MREKTKKIIKNLHKIDLWSVKLLNTKGLNLEIHDSAFEEKIILSLNPRETKTIIELGLGKILEVLK